MPWWTSEEDDDEKKDFGNFVSDAQDNTGRDSYNKK